MHKLTMQINEQLKVPLSDSKMEAVDPQNKDSAMYL